MIGQMAGGHIKPGPKSSLGSAWEKRGDYSRRRAEIRQTIDGLYATSRCGLWRMLLFLAVSIVALRFQDVELFANLPEQIREAMGAPPPPFLIHLVLAVSTVSALILIAGRGPEENGRESAGWLQFGMAVFFYPLYATTNTLSVFFPAVFAAGLLVMVCDHAVSWHHASAAIREEKERLGRMI
jgi:hypothetical protein